MARNMPPRLVAVTGFFRSSKDTEMTAILFVTFATAYVRGVTSFSRVKARMFCIQWRQPSTSRRVRISELSSDGILGASICKYL